MQFSEKPAFQHHPLIKALIGINGNSASGNGTTSLTTRNYNLTNNLTSVEAFNTNFTTLANGSNQTTYFENFEETPEPNKSNATAVPPCPETPPNLRELPFFSIPFCVFYAKDKILGGRIEIVKSPVPTVLDLEKRFAWLKPGGHWYPETCKVLKKVAIIVPFRCRGEHLLIFLQHMHPLLKKQQLDYTIFIIEQEGNGPFNRAMLMNIGFTEASKINDFHCFIFHDVDLLPEDDRNLYTCPEQPRHMSVAVDIFKYK